MFGIKSKSIIKSKRPKPKKNIPLSTEAKKKQQAAIVTYYTKKRKEENNRNK